MTHSGRSLEIVAVGLGQAGGNLAAEFHRRGYRGLAFNTAHTDLSSLASGNLALPESQRVYIGLEGSDGAGSDIAYGRECITENAERIRDAISEHAVGADVVVMAAGLGGGTGSCLASLIEAIEELSLPLVAVTPLPHHHESGIAKVNALCGIRDLPEANVNGWALIDNACLARLHHDTSMDSYFETINRAIVEPLDVFNRLNDRDSAVPIRTLDGEDFRTLLLAGGVLNYDSTTIDELSSAMVIGSVRDSLVKSPMMPSGFDLADVAYLGLVIEASEKTLSESPFSLYEEVAEKLKSETGGAAVYLGLYRTDDDAQTTVRLLSSSHALPGSVREMLSEAEREAGTIQQKVQQNLETLDLGNLEELRLSRRPGRGQRVGARVAPAAKPSPAPVAKDAPPAKREEPRGEKSPAPAKKAPAAVAQAAPAVKSAPKRTKAKIGPAVASKVEELRRLVAKGDATATAVRAAPKAEDAPANDASRDRYEKLVSSFENAKESGSRMNIARELVAGQRSGEALERFYAVRAMSRLDPDLFRDALMKAAKDPDAHVADVARKALERQAR